MKSQQVMMQWCLGKKINKRKVGNDESIKKQLQSDEHRAKR
jgi:hypothetical protein